MKISSYFDRNYLALSIELGTQKQAEILLILQQGSMQLQTALPNSYTDVTGEIGQENGQMVTYYVIQELKNSSRSMDKYRNILNNNLQPITVPIIFLTDELMDDGTIPPGCSRATLMTDLRNMMDIAAEDKINL